MTELRNHLVKFFRRNSKEVLSIVAAFAIVGVMFNVGVWDFQANVLSNKKSAPFDGTVTPVEKVPNWVALSSSEWKNSYDQIPLDKFINFPKYLPNQLTIPFGSLNFKNTADQAIRNAQVTFSTPYMGDYKLDGLEYAGSHLAVDIKMPTGTPVRSIANGVVIKAASEPSGFGNNVVIRHDEVPSINNANLKTTYYSGYAHMSNLEVQAGDLVSKGQLIGHSGQSGTATTPHLHFQIDNDQAPWHLYWPYTSKEASDAGVSFWEAVDIGLGKDKALATTISPLAYVQKYENYGSSQMPTNPITITDLTTTPAVDVNTNSEKSNINTPSDETTVDTDQLPSLNNSANATEPTNITTQPTLDVKPAPAELADFQLKYNRNFVVGSTQTVKVVALDKDGQIISNYAPSEETYIRIENGSATLNKTFLKASDWKEGIAEFNFLPQAGFGIRISVTSGSIKKLTDPIGETTFTDLNSDDHGYVAINFLKENDVVRGYPDGTFKPDNDVSRVESLKFIYEGLNKPVKLNNILEFADTDSKAWYARYVAAAQREGIVKGYAGNLFKPANDVTHAEFLKMLMEAAGYNIGNYQPRIKPFADVSTKAWYSGYVAVAKEKNLLNTSSNLFEPDQPMTRREVAELLYKAITLKISGQLKYNNNLVVSSNDLAGFYQQI